MRSCQRTSAILVGVAAVLALACATPDAGIAPEAVVLNTSLPPIQIRYGLDVDDVELGILLAIAAPSPAPALRPGEKITDDLLPAVLGGATGPRLPEHPWYVAGRRPGLVFAGYDRGDVAMRVAIKYDRQMVLLRIVESHNLGQSGDRIRADAFALLEDLDQRIRNSVLAVAQRNHYGTPIPTARR